MQQSPSKTIAFLGASGGLGLAALRRTLANGNRCVALCRDPSKFTAIFPEMDLNVDGPAEDDSAASTRRLTLVRGNAHDVDAVAHCLLVPGTANGVRRLVDTVVFTIGGKLIMSKLTLDDPNVCANGMATLLTALNRLRLEGATNSSGPNTPRIVVVSTTGISRCGRDVPLAFLPMYHGMLRVPHADKRVMEDSLVASGEMFAIVRPSFLVDNEADTAPSSSGSSGSSGGEGKSASEGPAFLKQLAQTDLATMSKKELEDLKATTKEELKEHKSAIKEEVKALEDKYKKEHAYKNIRVGIEDPVANKRISSAVGYTITRADAGRWLAENLVLPDELSSTYARRIATITY